MRQIAHRRLASPALVALMIASAPALATAQPPTSPARPPERITLSTPTVSVPIRTAGDRPIVDVMINGAGPFHLGVETGAPTLYLFSSAADKLHLRVPDPAAPGVTIADSIRIGGLRLDGVEVVLAGPSVLPGVLDGQLGLAVYRNLLMTVDFPRQELRFSRDSLPTPNGRDVLLLTRQGPIYSLRATAAHGTSIDLLLDTQGAATIALWADELPKVHVAGSPVTVGLLRSPAFRTIPKQMARLHDTVTIGRYRLVDPIVGVNSKRLPIGDGIIGIHTLKEFAVSLDQRHGRV